MQPIDLLGQLFLHRRPGSIDGVVQAGELLFASTEPLDHAGEVAGHHGDKAVEQIVQRLDLLLDLQRAIGARDRA